ncbi:hypothetical protein IWX78_002543 [Mycetocola sp. CAN_C7]|uniref:hypothetical protein n=1 Tax=Mycetocola sp. CAN_C7 TaxID=2787724 RepID=UPI0018C9EE2C
MTRTRALSVASIVLLAGLAVTACSSPEPAPSRTSEIPRGGSTTPSPSETPSAPPATSAPADWTPEALTTVCVDFQAEWAADNGYAADDFTWTVPGTTQQNGGLWYVYLAGTFTPPGESAVPAEFSCAISGTPDAPVIEESPGE